MLRPCRRALTAQAFLLFALATAVLPAAAESIDLSGVWRLKADWNEGGLAQGWAKPEADESQWRDITVPGDWESQGVTKPNPDWPATEDNDGYNGYAWYRKHVPIPAEWATGAITLRIGAIDDFDWTYVNNVKVGMTTGGEEACQQMREYRIPNTVLKPGQDNLIAIRVRDTGGRGGITTGPVELVREVGPAAVPPTHAGAGPRPAMSPEQAARYTETQSEMVKIGGDVRVPANMKVSGAVVAVGGSVSIEGWVQGPVTAVGGSVYLYPEARVDGPATAVGGTVEREPGAIVGGPVTEAPVLPSGLIKYLLRGAAPQDFRQRGFGGRHEGSIGNLLVGIFIAVLAVGLFRRRVEVMARALPLHPGRAAGYGVAGFVLAPAVLLVLALTAVVVIVVLLVTIVGILAIPVVPAALVAVLLAVVVALFLGTAAVWLGLGRAVLDRLGATRAHGIWAALLGLAILYVACLLPLVGGLIAATMFIFGIGVAIMTGVGADEDWIAGGAARRRSRPAEPEEPAAPPAPEVAEVADATATTAPEQAASDGTHPLEGRPEDEEPPAETPA